MLDRELTKAIVRKCWELVSSEHSKDLVVAVDSYARECSEFVEQMLAGAKLTPAQKRILSMEGLSDEERRSAVAGVVKVTSESEATRLLQHLVRTHLGILRMMAKSKIDVGDLMNRGLDLNRTLAGR